MAIEGRDIVIIGIQPWYFEIGSNCKSIAMEFQKQNRVLYVNTPVNRKTLYSNPDGVGIKSHINIIKNKTEPLRNITPALTEFHPRCIIESINWLPSRAAFRMVNRINNKRFAKEIRWAIEKLGFKDVILFNDSDFFNGVALKELLKPSVYIYYSRDYLRGFSYWKKHGDVLEPEMIHNADLAVANSAYLADYCRQHNPNAFYVGQGCNLALFDHDQKHDQPEELKNLNGPVVGYVGAITSERLDMNIIRIIAKAKPEWNIVMVGPEDHAFAASDLHQLPNVYFTGRKNMEELPAYIQHFNVCINPQLLNQTTIGNYPLKVDEYLAMGKPVVATRTRTMEVFSDHCALANSPDDYPGLIEAQLDHNCPATAEGRIAFAKTHTWENSVGAIYDAIDVFSKKNKAIG